MKKLLGIVVLGLLLSGNAYASSNLKGIKEFKLSVSHDGECNGENFTKDLETSVKYILGNSKIKLTSEARKEQLEVYILTASGTDLCASVLEVNSYYFDSVKNSSGRLYFGRIPSYNSLSLKASSPARDHREAVINKVEGMIKKFIVEWLEAQK